MKQQIAKYRLLVVAIAMLISCIIKNNAFGQFGELNTSQRDHFKIFGGVGLPMGDFSSTSLQNQYSGFAKPGISLGAEMYSEIGQGLVIGAMGSFSMHSVDKTEMQKQFEALLVQLNPTTKIRSLDVNSWYLFGIMGNMGFKTPASTQVDIYGKVYLGVLIGKSPEINATAETTSPIQQINANQSSATATGLGYGVGAGIVIDNQFDLGVQYLTGEPEYEITAKADSHKPKIVIRKSTMQRYMAE
jgi:hypothetical protein